MLCHGKRVISGRGASDTLGSLLVGETQERISRTAFLEASRWQVVLVLQKEVAFRKLRERLGS